MQLGKRCISHVPIFKFMFVINLKRFDKYVTVRYSRIMIYEVRKDVMWMKFEKVLKNYLPMTETAFYILISLTKPRHGYGIIKHVEEITNERIRLGSGTIYGTLNKMQRDGIITVFSDGKRKTIYEITETGKGLMLAEMNRLKELHKNTLKYEEAFK